MPPSRRAHVHIALLTRRAVPDWAVLPPNAASKTTTIIHADFTAYSPELAARLAEHDACIWALGRSSMGMTEEEYTATTYTSVMNAARALRDAGVGAERPADKPFRFVYISGEHANPEGKSRQMWARVKVHIRYALQLGPHREGTDSALQGRARLGCRHAYTARATSFLPKSTHKTGRTSVLLRWA